ncbi:acetate/propionate family kinase [Oceanicaulis sp. UBA2681]|uniref:acetate/propionate family kinase n=1 Tax=Oceanicaulis sp. UBA2681 TaxID=1947007 RepID=UPI0025803EFD|nr:acetate/propionate family kinase [Oceanicaulis sp. UBA2681]|tara:strand:+ start:11811 stop:12971 length:1161 start_codon:yes stop_codon:yes gene_type:complete
MSLVVLNAGSSSLKFAVFTANGQNRQLTGHIDGVGEAMQLTVKRNGVEEHRPVPAAADHGGAMAAALDILADEIDDQVRGVGHRIVHGGTRFTDPVILTPEVEADLDALSPLAPLHQPHNLAGVQAARRAFPDAIQIGCFDTAFHRTHPWVNDTFALPLEYFDKGVRRYGFHGLSYKWLTRRMEDLSPGGRPQRMILAHLGAGASMCAVKDGRSIGSTMGFSALDGLPMATRCGQIDPGVLLHLMESEGMDAIALTELLYKQSGLKGLSGLSGDMRVLEASETQEAAQALDYFVFRCRREIGALTGVLEGLDALVFAGGVGENAQSLRSRICSGFEYLGLAIDEDANRAVRGDAARISAADSHVDVWMIPTDEEAVIADAMVELLS